MSKPLRPTASSAYQSRYCKSSATSLLSHAGPTIHLGVLKSSFSFAFTPLFCVLGTSHPSNFKLIEPSGQITYLFHILTYLFELSLFPSHDSILSSRFSISLSKFGNSKSNSLDSRDTTFGRQSCSISLRSHIPERQEKRIFTYQHASKDAI